MVFFYPKISYHPKIFLSRFRVFHRRFTAEQPTIGTCNIRLSLHSTAAQYRKPPFARFRLPSGLSSTLQHSWLPKVTYSRASIIMIRSDRSIDTILRFSPFTESHCLPPPHSFVLWLHLSPVRDHENNAITTDKPNFVIKSADDKKQIAAFDQIQPQKAKRTP